jgi:hypothetical protein
MPEETIESEQVEVPIDHYSVQLGAFASRDPGRAPSQNVQIFLDPPPEHSHGSMLIQFKVDTPRGLGHIIRAARVNLTAFFPPEAFANFYSVLRAEKPVFVQYTLREDPHSLEDAAEARVVNLESFHLTTSHEPVGEGPVDLSGDGEHG